MSLLDILDILFGKPLASSEERAEKIGTLEGIPIFGLDALGSAAYGAEAALTLLLPLAISLEALKILNQQLHFILFDLYRLHSA
jgi:hypothetical protein